MTYAEKPWIKSYKLGPYKLKETQEPYPKVPLFKALDDSAANYPGKIAIEFQGRSLKYRDLKRQVDALANALAKMGVEKGDRICIFLPNSIECIISSWAGQKAGGVTSITSIVRSDHELLTDVQKADSKVIICTEENLERVLELKAQSNIEHVIVTSDAGYDVSPIKAAMPKGTSEFRKLIEDNDPTPPQVDIDPEEDLCEILFTGGSTGIPKGVMHTHYNRYTNLLQGLPWLLNPLSTSIIGKASVFIPLPLFHGYGHILHQAAILWGLRLILMPDPRDIDAIVATIREHRPFLIPTVPTQLMRMAQAKVGRLNTMFMSGAAPLPDEIRALMKKETGQSISEFYGLTETSITHINPSGFSKITGFMAQEKLGVGIVVPDTECKVVDPTTGNDVPIGEDGELVTRGPQTMVGYWPERGSGLTDDGWCHSGDIGHMDEDGYFYISDRIKDMVNVSGMKVYTTLVDGVLFKHPGVLMAAAFGVPDTEIPGSERVMAVIRLKDEYKGKVDKDDIITFCKEHLSAYEVPRYVEFKDDMPVTLSQKLSKKTLKEEALIALGIG